MVVHKHSRGDAGRGEQHPPARQLEGLPAGLPAALHGRTPPPAAFIARPFPTFEFVRDLREVGGLLVKNQQHISDSGQKIGSLRRREQSWSPKVAKRNALGTHTQDGINRMRTWPATPWTVIHSRARQTQSNQKNGMERILWGRRWLQMETFYFTPDPFLILFHVCIFFYFTPDPFLILFHVCIFFISRLTIFLSRVKSRTRMRATSSSYTPAASCRACPRACA